MAVEDQEPEPEVDEPESGPEVVELWHYKKRFPHGPHKL